MRAACGVDLPGREPPSEFRIFPRGVVSSTKGQFLFDDAAASAVMAASVEHGVDFMIDFDHHAMHTDKGVKAIAAGWFSLALRDDGLWATNVRWTPVAEAHLRAGEYRYFSPLFDFDPKNGRITNLINNALTNTPAIHGLEALVAASLHSPTKGTAMRTEMTSTASEQESLAIQARIAHVTGGRMPSSARAALSSTTGTASRRAALAQKTDAQLVAELTDEQRKIMFNLHGDDPRAISKAVRKVALTALDRADREAGEALAEAGRGALAIQGAR